MTNYSAAIALATSNTTLVQNLSGLSVMEGDDWGYGYNLGVLFEPTKDMRVGLSYRSQVKLKLEGTVTFDGVPVTASPTLNAWLNTNFANGPVTATITLPDSLSTSLYSRLNDKLELLADVTWTNWSKFVQLKVDRTSGANVSTTPENWEDSWRYSLGANYRQDDQKTWKFGVAYDQTPVPDQYRTVRIPDESRLWLALGLQYRLANKDRLDAAYTHLFVNDANINSTVTGQGTLNGSYSSHVDILSVQYTHSF
jgi:long-chain fatty acid transport protein